MKYYSVFTLAFVMFALFFILAGNHKDLPELNQAVKESRNHWLIAMIRKNGSFFSATEKAKIFQRQALEKKRFGLDRHIKKYKKEKMGNTVLEQRSGRKRLYDHNIFLRSIFADKIIFKGVSLKTEMNQATFVDIGSAILFQDGAPTVRDIFEDKELRQNLHQIVATDINDSSSAKNRYIDIYKKQKKKLPFPVREIPLAIVLPEQVKALFVDMVKNDKSAIIFRAANSGPDLFYSTNDLEKHFDALSLASLDRPVIYLFNIYVLYKSPDENLWRILGTIDEKVGLNHRASTWTEINWSRRTLRQAFKPSNPLLQIK